MNKRLFRESIRAPLPKLGKMKSAADFSKTPKSKDRFTQELSPDFVKNIEKVYILERKVEELTTDLAEANKIIFELKKETQRNEEIKGSPRALLCGKNALNKENEIHNSSLEITENGLSNLIVENEQLRHKISSMDLLIKEQKQSSKKICQDFQTELIRCKASVENSERCLKLKEIEILELKKMLRSLETQKSNFVNIIKDLELEIIDIKQAKPTSLNEEQSDSQFRLKEKEIIMTQLTQQKEKNDLVTKDVMKLNVLNNILVLRCKDLQTKLEKKKSSSFLHKFKLEQQGLLNLQSLGSPMHHKRISSLVTPAEILSSTKPQLHTRSNEC